MDTRRFVLLVFAATTMTAFLNAQQPAKPTEPPTEVAAPRDPSVEAAAQWINRALFLRCFCADDNLTFDAAGHPTGSPKTTDWTLSGITIQKVSRKSPTEIELDGLRAAIRFAPDRREFDRHNQNDDKMHLLLADPGDPAALNHALHAIFSEGLDRPLQLSMPPYWQHYFEPNQPWPPDDITNQKIETILTPSPTATPPVVTHKAAPNYTAAASRDRVTGTVRMHAIIDLQGTTQRLVIDQPLGYGLDERAVEAATKCRFTPATFKGQSYPSYITLNEDFVVVGQP